MYIPQKEIFFLEAVYLISDINHVT